MSILGSASRDRGAGGVPAILHSRGVEAGEALTAEVLDGWPDVTIGKAADEERAVAFGEARRGAAVVQARTEHRHRERGDARGAGALAGGRDPVLAYLRSADLIVPTL